MANPSPVILPSERLEGGWKSPAPAKLNRFLHITGRRDDGYHLIETGFQFVDLCDWIHVRVSKDPGIRILDDPLHLGSKNLVVRAAEALSQGTQGLEICIDKTIPSGGGLGGGSSDAATTLVMLNELWELHHSTHTLMQVALSLGADVPVFVFGHSCFASGIGEQCESEDWPGKTVLLANPGVSVSTEAVFTHPKLTRDTPSCRIRASQLDTTSNDCETLVRTLHPEVDQLLAQLTAFGMPRMTGTGSTCFVVDPVLEDANALSELRQQHWVSQGLLSNRSMLYTHRANA